MRHLLTVVSLLILAACGSPAPPSGPPVIVHAAGAAGSDLDRQLQEFSVDTKTAIIVHWGDSNSNTDRLISKADDTVDVLITDNVADIWRAADAGALRPIPSELLAQVPEELMDPDSYWAAISVRPHAIAIAPGEVRPLLGDYDGLGDPDLKGRLCLSSSKLSVNRSLIGMLIDDRGIKNTERLVRAWIRNLAATPFASQDDLIAALQDGRCDFGIVALQPNIGELTVLMPSPNFMDIDAIGIARHTQRPDRAQLLVGWLLNKNRIQLKGTEQRPVAIAGWRNEEALLLIERAGYH